MRVAGRNDAVAGRRDMVVRLSLGGALVSIAIELPVVILERAARVLQQLLEEAPLAIDIVELEVCLVVPIKKYSRVLRG